VYAVIKTGGKQYRVSEGDRFKVEKLDVKVGSTFKLDTVLMLGDVDSVKIGTPSVKDVSVACEVLEQGRDKKIVVFKKKRRKRYKIKRGHRQPFTLLKVTSINAPGSTSKRKVAAKPVAKKTSKKATPKKSTVKTTAAKTQKKTTTKKGK
jgi:large subunit ribosomal protein L21